MSSGELEVTADLSDALAWVLGDAPTEPDPVVVAAALLDSLAKGYGLSESSRIDEDPFERADPPTPALELLRRLIDPEAPELTADAMRDGLYEAFRRLAQDRDARRALNRNQPLTDQGLLRLGQIYWNLEATQDRPQLPIHPRQTTGTGRASGATGKADIPVPGANRDFATMNWSDRAKQGSGSTSGQGFRKQGARLAVLAAQHLVTGSPTPLPDLASAVLHHIQTGQGGRIASIEWPQAQPITEPAAATPAQPEQPATHPVPRADPAVEVHPVWSDGQRVVVGGPAEVGADYQLRNSDAEIAELWAQGGDRRVWLRGGPGLGKSYTARRIMQEAIAYQGPDREVLLVWVDSADPASVAEAFAAAADQLRQQGVPVPGSGQDTAERKARALLGTLATSSWRWLVVLDNANASALLQAGLVPTGGNPNGRVLVTTLSRDHRLTSHGHVVAAQLFTPEEAEAYLRSDVHFRGIGRGTLARATQEEAAALAEAVGHHPLALSVAAATIGANAMTVTDWIEEFGEAESMDDAADEPDRGGYPHTIGAAWQIALRKAAAGMPDGVVERAALVAALQDPDGHPTWLWDREPVTEWVEGGSKLARRHGMPVAVQRLIDTGILELHGDTWRSGRVAIHQLAARAVRENAARPMAVELAGILADQWLLRLTEEPSDATPEALRRNLQPIEAHPDLPWPVQQTATALLAYREPTATDLTRQMAEELEPYLEAGGTTLRIEVAEKWLEVGDTEAARGGPVEARAAYCRAADLYGQLVQEHPLLDHERAECLMGLGNVQAQLGNLESSRASREQAAEILEELADNTSNVDSISGYLVDLVRLYELLADNERKSGVLARAEEFLMNPPDELSSSADYFDVWGQGSTWRNLSRLMAEAGRTEIAKEYLARESALYERFPEHWQFTYSQWSHAVRDLAILLAGSGEWADAQRQLVRITEASKWPWRIGDGADPGLEMGRTFQRDALVLLASVQTHLGRRADADQSLSRSAATPTRRQDENDPDEKSPPHQKDRSGEWRGEYRRIRLMGADRRDRSRLRILGWKSLLGERWEEAQELTGSWLGLVQRAANTDPADPKLESELADAYQSLASALVMQEAYQEAATHLARAVDIRQLLTDLDPSRADDWEELARAHLQMAAALGKLKREQESLESMAKSINTYRQLLEMWPNDTDYLRLFATALRQAAITQGELGNLDEAVNYRKEAVSILQGLAEQNPDDRVAAEELATALNSLARAQVELGDVDGSARSYEEQLRILGRLADQTPDDPEAHRRLAEIWGHLGLSWFVNDRLEEAVGPLRRSLAIYTFVAALSGPDNRAARKDLANVHSQLGYVLGRNGKSDEAVTHLHEAVTVLRGLADSSLDDREIQLELAQALAFLGDTYARTGQLEQAVHHLTRSINIFQLLADLGPDERPDMLIALLHGLSDWLRDLGRTGEADEAEVRARDLAARYPDEDDE